VLVLGDVLTFQSRHLQPHRVLRYITHSLSLAHSPQMASAVAEDGLSIQNVDALDPSKLTPLTPEVISRQVHIFLPQL